jgi:glycine betaine catabolism A
MVATNPPEPVPEAPGEHLSGHTLPGTAYWDPEIYRLEMDRFFGRRWLCAGRASAIPEAGDYFVRSVGDESVVVMRGRDGQVRAFFNVCRHRGSRLLGEREGKGLKAITCPYHAWTYTTEGRLLAAPHTKSLVDFSKEDYGLYPARSDSWGGFVWVNLDAEAAPLRSALSGFVEKFERFPLADLRPGDRRGYTVAANWKTIVENYSECYHCAPIHPELNRITPYFTGDNFDFFTDPRTRGHYAGGFMTFEGDFTSMTRSGYTTRPALRGMNAEDRRRIYYYTLLPNCFFSLHPDYLMVHYVWPQEPGRTQVDCEWYFEPETMARPDFDPKDAVELWDLINRQDWEACERTQLGVRSHRFRGGRFSQYERMVCDFDTFVENEIPEERR